MGSKSKRDRLLITDDVEAMEYHRFGLRGDIYYFHLQHIDRKNSIATYFNCLSTTCNFSVNANDIRKHFKIAIS